MQWMQRLKWMSSAERGRKAVLFMTSHEPPRFPYDTAHDSHAAAVADYGGASPGKS
jgi:hypothetical protein